MKTTKRIVAILGLTIAILGCIYYFYIRERHIDVLHTEINMDEFSSDNEGIESMIDWYYETYHVPAISVALIENGKVSRYISRGKLNKNSDIEVSEKTIYQIASLSKTITGMICNSLELEGLLDVDKPIVESLKNELSDEAKKKLGSIKLKNLIFHNSGLGRSMPGITREDIIKSLEETELEFSPETKWQYSNYAYALIALLLEKETGKTYQELLHENVKDKYGMEILEAGLDYIPKERLATAYWKHFKLFENEVFDFQMQNGASGLFTTTESLSKLIIQQIKDYQAVDSIKNVSPLHLNRDKVLSYGTDGFYGYGIFEKNFRIKYDTTVTNNYLCHGGDADGFVSNYGFFPQYGVGIVALSTSGGPWFWAMERNLNVKIIEKYMKGVAVKPTQEAM